MVPVHHQGVVVGKIPRRDGSQHRHSTTAPLKCTHSPSQDELEGAFLTAASGAYSALPPSPSPVIPLYGPRWGSLGGFTRGERGGRTGYGAYTGAQL